MLSVAVAINPSSGRGRGEAYGHKTLRALEKYSVCTIPVIGVNADDCLRQCRRLAQAGGIDALIAVGGDGMVHLAVQALHGTKIPLGIVAVGSGNDIAREFKLPIRRVDDSIHHIMSALIGQRGRLVDTIEISTADTTHYAMAVLSAGFDAAVNRETNELSWPKGNMRYVRALFSVLSAWKPYGVRIEIDGRRNEGALSLISIANTRFFGGGMNIAPDARPDDGLLNVVIASPVSKMHLLRVFPLVYSGIHYHARPVHTFTGQHIRIYDAMAHGAKAPIAMADGEIVGELPLDIRCLPQSLTLLL